MFKNDNTPLKFKNKILGILCLLITATMIGGIDSLFERLGSVGSSLKVILMLLFVVFVSVMITKNSKIIINLSGMLTFVLCFVMVIASICGLLNPFREQSVTQEYMNTFSINNVINGIFSVIFYVSMNMLSCFGIVKKIAISIKNKSQIVIISLISSVLLFILITLIIGVLNTNPELIISSMPMLDVAKSLGDWFYYIYFVFLFSGCVVSIISVAYSGRVYLFSDSSVGEYVFPGFVFMIFSYIISRIGFDFLIEKIYPLIGMIYLLMTFFELIHTKIMCKKRKNV